MRSGYDSEFSGCPSEADGPAWSRTIRHAPTKYLYTMTLLLLCWLFFCTEEHGKRPSPHSLRLRLRLSLFFHTAKGSSGSLSLSPSLSLSLCLSLSLSLSLEHGQVAPVLARTRGWQVLAGFCLYTSLSLSLCRSPSCSATHTETQTDRTTDRQTATQMCTHAHKHISSSHYTVGWSVMAACSCGSLILLSCAGYLEILGSLSPSRASVSSRHDLVGAKFICSEALCFFG